MKKTILYILLIICSIVISLGLFSQNDSLTPLPVDTVHPMSVEELNKKLQEEIANKSDEEQDQTSVGEKEEIKINKGIEIGFSKKEIEPKEGEILSNVLIVINHNPQARIVLPQYNYPANWKFIGKKDVWYEIEANDTIFIPVRIIPRSVPKGQSNFQINAFVYNREGIQILSDNFNCVTKKIAQWKVNNSSDKIYFRNGETETDLGFEFTNSSVFPQEIFMSVNSVKGMLELSQEGEILDNGENQTFELASYGDTSFQYTASIENLQRNFRQISLVGYQPNTNYIKRSYQVFLHSREPKTIGNLNYMNGSKIDLIKLPNALQVQQHGRPVLPLDVEANYQNILGISPFLSVNMTGMKNFENDAFLTYFSQLNYSQVYWNQDFLDYVPWYIGYFDKRYNVQAGAINGGVIGLPAFGKGIKGAYQINPKHEVGAFFTSSRGFLKTGHTDSYGLHYQYMFEDNGFVLGKLGRFTNGITGADGIITTVQSNFKIKEKHGVGIFGAFSNRNQPYIGSLTNQNGFLIGGTYSSRFMENRLFINTSARYNSTFFGTSFSERFTSNTKAQYQFSDKWSGYYSLNYNDITNISSLTGFYNPFSSYRFIQNRLIFTTNNKFGTMNPGLYYHINDFYGYNVHSRGLSFRFSNLDYVRNTLFSFYIEGGYNNSISQPEISEFFSLRANSLARIKTITLTANYRYGAYNKSALDYQTFTGSAPQMARVSGTHQYQFKNPHWVLESSLNYTYNNRFKTQFLGAYPEIFYFSNSGWRYSLNPSYTLRVARYNDEFENLYNNLPIIDDEDQTRTVTKGFRLSASVRKNFGIPVPFAKHHSSNASFLAFYDMNGNGKQDRDEPTIENVVVKVGQHEVLTNGNGFALIENLPNKTYSLTTIPLDELNGWFAKTEDSLSIITSNIYPVPFVRGVKVIGDVILDRQDIAVVDDRPFDLSNIRISANDGENVYSVLTNFDGSYELYLPNGNYTLTIDETILGSKYSLLQNNVEISLEANMENIYTSFFIVEKERKVNLKKFGEGRTIIKSKE